MPRSPAALTAAICLLALLPQARANGSLEEASFQEISQRALADELGSNWTRVEMHREWFVPGQGLRHEWIVATVGPEGKNPLQEVATLWHDKKHPPRDVSWHEATKSDWRGKFSKHWGNDHTPGRPSVEAWLERYCMTAIPEPGSLAMLLSGAGFLGFVARRRRERS